MRYIFVEEDDGFHEVDVLFDDELGAGVGVVNFFADAEAAVGDFAVVEEMDVF